VITLTADKRVLVAEINNDSLRAAQGSMVAFEGSVEFVGAKMGGGDGFRAALKRRVAGESLDLMEARGTGRVFFAEDALDVTVLDVGGSRLTLESDHILAVTPGLRLDVQFAGLRGMTSGQGLATTTVDGQGQIAVKSDGPIFGLEASPGQDVVVDPDAYVGSYGNLQMSMVSGVSWKSLVGEGTGEPFSLRITGHGLVYVQSAER